MPHNSYFCIALSTLQLNCKPARFRIANVPTPGVTFSTKFAPCISLTCETGAQTDIMSHGKIVLCIIVLSHAMPFGETRRGETRVRRQRRSQDIFSEEHFFKARDAFRHRSQARKRPRDFSYYSHEQYTSKDVSTVIPPPVTPPTSMSTMKPEMTTRFPMEMSTIFPIEMSTMPPKGKFNLSLTHIRNDRSSCFP